MNAISLPLAAMLVLSGSAASAADKDLKTTAKQYDDQIRPFLDRHCVECHGPERTKGKLRLDRLAPDFAGKANRDRWLTVLERVETGEMPPKEKPRPPE